MKKLLFVFVIFPLYFFGQINPINFENSGVGSAWTWTVFENDDNPILEIINNPISSGINTSKTVAKFTARRLGQPWAGCETLHGSDIGSFSFDSSNCIIKIMVFKNKISDVGIKFVDPTSAAQPEIKVSNTLVNQWEELTFDFSSRIGVFPIIKDQIVIFPDFDPNPRYDDEVILFDNITFTGFNNPVSWECINSICTQQNNNNGSYSDSLSCVNFCMQSSTFNYNVNKKKIIKISNFLGKESSPNKYMPQIYFYDDGTVEKKLLKYY
tara:strand:+ start:382 stop:1185 length:804 start_codon:yes stop_codon:yes gene_type:complete